MHCSYLQIAAQTALGLADGCLFIKSQIHFLKGADPRSAAMAGMLGPRFYRLLFSLFSFGFGHVGPPQRLIDPVLVEILASSGTGRWRCAAR